ncbi:MAG: thiamine pyrophosphate-dependent enzyme [Acidimicrobiia bacterium]
MSGTPDLARLYRSMVRMRVLEEELARLWRAGLVSGELHLGVGEEGVIAGITDHLGVDDAVALDYRPTPALVARGVDIAAIVLEVLGHPQGLGGGQGGHMHLLDPDHLAISTGIVGSPAPLACGLALSAARLRPGTVAVGFFGDGAVNQGMVMEAWNLASVWKLPVVFVVKDNRWAATTRTERLRAGSIAGRARSFLLPTAVVDGNRVEAVWHAAGSLVAGARQGRPGVLVASCRRPAGHMLDDTLSRTVRSPAEMLRLTADLVRVRGGQAGRRGVADLAATVTRAFVDGRLPHADPLRGAARRLGAPSAEVEAEARAEVLGAVERALSTAGVSL